MYTIEKGNHTMQYGHENHVILVGTLVNIGRGDKKEASFARRNTLGATLTSFSLELTSPFGDAFLIPFEAVAQTAGTELLTRNQIGQPVVVEGTIRRRVTTDRRMAVADNDTGTRTIETQITVAQIRPAREDEPLGYSAVWIEGRVITPPRMFHHRTLRDMEMARMIVQITRTQPSPYPGSKAAITEQMEVQVALPTLAEGAELLYRPGNIVRIEGQLDMNRIPQAAALVQDKLNAMEQEWQAQRAALEASITHTQERERQVATALRRYRNQRANVQETALMTVVAGYVELVQGETLTEEQVAAVARASTQRGRTARLARIRRAPQNERFTTAAPVATVEAVVAPAAEVVEAAEAAAAAAGNQSRRRRNGRFVSAAAETPAAETPAEAAWVLNTVPAETPAVEWVKEYRPLTELPLPTMSDIQAEVALPELNGTAAGELV